MYRKELSELIELYNSPYILKKIEKLFISNFNLPENIDRQVKGSSVIGSSQKFKSKFYKKISKF